MHRCVVNPESLKYDSLQEDTTCFFSGREVNLQLTSANSTDRPEHKMNTMSVPGYCPHSGLVQDSAWEALASLQFMDKVIKRQDAEEVHGLDESPSPECVYVDSLRSKYSTYTSLKVYDCLTLSHFFSKGCWFFIRNYRIINGTLFDFQDPVQASRLASTCHSQCF